MTAPNHAPHVMAATSLIITPRLRLSPASRGDGWELWELWSHPAVREALFGLQAFPIDAAGALLDACKARHPGLWVIRSQVNTRLLGCITLCGWPHLAEAPALGGVSSGAAELSIAMLPSVWGRGYATEAAQALLAQVLQETRISMVQATCRSDDLASLALLQGLGFLPRKQRSTDDGQYSDHLLHAFVFYALLRGKARQRRRDSWSKLASNHPQIVVNSAVEDGEADGQVTLAEFADTDVTPLPREAFGS
jgi:[ribosomal protein S5]-alanine N-acetyltransferase